MDSCFIHLDGSTMEFFVVLAQGKFPCPNYARGFWISCEGCLIRGRIIGGISYVYEKERVIALDKS